MKNFLIQYLNGALILAGSFVVFGFLRHSYADTSDAVFEMEAINVTTKRIQRVDQFGLGPVEYLDEDELQRTVQSTLGETLSWQPGVSSNYFSAGASRPVIRGFEGYRVRLLQDGIGTLDISETSPDHGVALEPLLIREVDIHRGPGALLFGNQAIGGAVNARSRLLANERPDKTVSGAFETRYETISDGTSASGYVEVGADAFVINAVGAVRQLNDYEIPGKARTDIYEQEVMPRRDVPNVGSVPVVNPEGVMPNSFYESVSRGIGISWLPESLPVQLGFAYSRYDSEYGLPYQFVNVTELFGDSALDMAHERFDFDVRIEPGYKWLTSIHFHGGYGDYNHIENIIGKGSRDAGENRDEARFDQHAIEGRIDFFHEPSDWLEGVIGVQSQRQDLYSWYLLVIDPFGSFRIPRDLESENMGFYLLETASFKFLKVQTGIRYEIQSLRDNPSEQFARGDDSFSTATNFTWTTRKIGFLEELSVTPSISYVQRIPTVTERLAFWPNPAILRFLRGGDLDGNPLKNEESLGLELGIEARRRNSSARLNVYHYDYANFVFLQDVADTVGNVAEYTEREATFYGYEAEVSAWKTYDSGTTLTLTVMSDYVHARNETDSQPLPRIPPRRVGGRVELSSESWTLGADLRYAFEQQRVQPAGGAVLPEYETNAYTEVNFDANRDFKIKGATLTGFLKANNLLDVERRIHSSFVKDVAPLPGRSFTVGLRCAF